jgi:hypothetical protein
MQVSSIFALWPRSVLLGPAPLSVVRRRLSEILHFVEPVRLQATGYRLQATG